MTINTAGAQLSPYLEPLTEMQRIFVTCKLKGMTDTAAGTAAGVANPTKNSSRMMKSAAVQEAIKAGVDIAAREIMFSRKEAHDMLMDAHRNAANTTEQVLAIREMIKLHGIAAPEVKQIEHKHAGRIEHAPVAELSDADLFKLAKLPTDQLPDIIDGEYELVEASTDSSGAGSGPETGTRRAEAAEEEAQSADSD
jgi:hypothetical protein